MFGDADAGAPDKGLGGEDAGDAGARGQELGADDAGARGEAPGHIQLPTKDTQEGEAGGGSPQDQPDNKGDVSSDDEKDEKKKKKKDKKKKDKKDKKKKDKKHKKRKMAESSDDDADKGDVPSTNKDKEMEADLFGSPHSEGES